MTVAVIGEALIDLVDDARPGGSPLNVAVGLARLEQPVRLFARLSSDTYGTLLRAHASGVDLSTAITTDEPSTVATVRLDADGTATYDFGLGADFGWIESELAPLAATDADVVHFGSLASWLPPGAVAVDRAVAARRAAGTTLISYDPNVRPSLQPDPVTARADVERSIAHAHLVKASTDDIAYLYPGVDRAAVAADWLTRGPRLVVITRGADGPIAFTPHGSVQRPPHPVEVIDTVGAGDAFMAGLLDALLRRDAASPGTLGEIDLAGVLDDAALVAALTCARLGADPPTRAEVDSAVV